MQVGGINTDLEIASRTIWIHEEIRTGSAPNLRRPLPHQVIHLIHYSMGRSTD